MSIEKTRAVNNIIISKIITIHSDGYIRLTFDELKKIPFVHLMSFLDENNGGLSKKIETFNFSKTSGYTEWGSDTNPTISIGWDWIIDVSTAAGNHYKRSSQPRSNLMLISDKNCDLGLSKTNVLIEKIINEVAWSDEVELHIRKQYAS